MKISLSEIDKAVDDHLEKPEKGNVSAYVNLELWAAFKDATGERPHNLVLEALMRAYIEGKQGLKSKTS